MNPSVPIFLFMINVLRVLLTQPACCEVMDMPPVVLGKLDCVTFYIETCDPPGPTLVCDETQGLGSPLCACRAGWKFALAEMPCQGTGVLHGALEQAPPCIHKPPLPPSRTGQTLKPGLFLLLGVCNCRSALTLQLFPAPCVSVHNQDSSPNSRKNISLGFLSFH